MTRKIKIEEHGASFGRDGGSTIRLKGKWLRQLGFSPKSFVELTAVSPGVLEIRLCGVAPVARDFAITAHRLDHAIAIDEARRLEIAAEVAARVAHSAAVANHHQEAQQ